MSEMSELEAARARNGAYYGTEAEAREYAEDLGAGYCPKCMAVYHFQPGLPNEGHECSAHDAGSGSGVE